MRLWLYMMLTSAIKLIAGWRYRLGNKCCWEVRWERDARNLIPSSHLSDKEGTTCLGCCDCGLDHAIWVDEPGLHLVPLRPKGFKYKEAS